MELWYSRPESPGAEFRLKVLRPLFSREEGGHRIDVLESEGQGKLLLLDGDLVLAESDAAAYREMAVHVPLNARPGIRRVLVAGGGDGNILSELLRYPEIESIVVAEPDTGLAETARAFFPELGAAFDDPRALLVREDPASYIRETRERFDLAILDGGTGGSELDQAFYCDLFRLLSGDGVLVHRAGSAYFLQKRRELLRVLGRVKRLFPLYRVYRAELPATECGPILLGYASKRFDPLAAMDAEGWRRRGLSTRYYNPAMHRAAFALPQELESLIEGA